MENRIVTFQEKDVYENAEKYFAVSCGMLRRGNRFQKMYEAGLSVRERIKCKENIRAVYAESKNFKFIDNELIVEDIPFICDSFRQIDFSDVESIYLFVITSGEHKVESESIKDSFYADVWGTCYVESGRDALKGMVQDDNPGKYVLDSFGPGYFGMPLSELEKFFQLLDCEKAGISLYESGV